MDYILNPYFLVNALWIVTVIIVAKITAKKKDPIEKWGEDVDAAAKTYE